MHTRIHTHRHTFLVYNFLVLCHLHKVKYSETLWIRTKLWIKARTNVLVNHNFIAVIAKICKWFSTIIRCLTEKFLFLTTDFFSSFWLLFSDVYLANISKMLFLWFHLLLWVCFIFISYKLNQIDFSLDNNKWKIDGSKYQEIKKEFKQKKTYKYW